MHTETAGTGSPTVVFVHGFACDGSDWRAQFARLAQVTAVVSCDLRGHGATPAGPAPYSIKAFGDDVAELVASLDAPPVVIVGHSMGCRVALQAFVDAPERVAGLVLVDGSRAGGGDPQTAERAMAEQLAGDGYEPFVRRFFEEMFTPASDPHVADAIITRALALPQEVGAPLFASIVGWDLSVGDQALDAVEVPLLAIQSTAMTPQRVRTPLLPGQKSPWLELTDRHVPTARVEVIPNVGHFAQIEAADQVSELIAGFVGSLRNTASESR